MDSHYAGKSKIFMNVDRMSTSRSPGDSQLLELERCREGPSTDRNADLDGNAGLSELPRRSARIGLPALDMGVCFLCSGD